MPLTFRFDPDKRCIQCEATKLGRGRSLFGRKSWQKRVFVLDAESRELRYLKPGGGLKGSVVIRGATVTVSNDDPAHPHMIEVTTQDKDKHGIRVLKLFTDTAEDRNALASALRLAAAGNSVDELVVAWSAAFPGLLSPTTAETSATGTPAPQDVVENLIALDRAGPSRPTRSERPPEPPAAAVFIQGPQVHVSNLSSTTSAVEPARVDALDTNVVMSDLKALAARVPLAWPYVRAVSAVLHAISSARVHRASLKRFEEHIRYVSSRVLKLLSSTSPPYSQSVNDGLVKLVHSVSSALHSLKVYSSPLYLSNVLSSHVASGLLEMADARISECFAGLGGDAAEFPQGNYSEIAQAVGPVRAALSAVIRKVEGVSDATVAEVAVLLDSTVHDVREQLFMHFEVLAVSSSASLATVGAHVTLTTPILQLFWFLNFPDLDEVPVDRFIAGLKKFLVEKCGIAESELGNLFSTAVVHKLSCLLDGNNDALVSVADVSFVLGNSQQSLYRTLSSVALPPAATEPGPHLIGREDSLQSVRAELSTFRPVYTVSGARGSGVSSFLRCLHDRLAEYNVVFVDAHWCPDFTTVAGELCTVLRMHAVQSLQASLEAWCAAQRAKIIVIIDAGQAELSHIVQSLSELAIGGNVMFVLGSTAASSLVADAYLGPLKSSDAIALMTNRAPYLQSRMDAAVDVLVVSPGAIAVLESPPPESFTSEEWTVAALLHHRPQPSTMDAIVLESLGGFSGPFGADIGAPVASVHRGVFVGMMDHFATLGFVEKCPPSRWRRAGATIGDVTPQNLTGFVRAFVVLSNVIERLCMAGVSTAAVSLLDRYSTDYQRFWKLCSGATELPDDAVKCLTGCDWRTAAAARLRLDEQLAVAAGIAAVTLRVAGETTQPFAKVTSWLAHVNAEKGAREPAVALYNQALTIARSIGANGVVADCLSGLAYSHVFSGDLPSALVLYKEAEAVQRAIQGPSHPDVAFALKNIGSVLHEQGELQAALEAYDAALTIERMRITLDISKTLAAKALILKKLGRVDACAAAYREAIDVRQRILGHCHPSVAVLQCAAANALFALQQYNDALDLYLAALSIQQQLLGQTHADVALLKSNIGSVLKHLKRYDEAVSAYQEAIAIKRTLHGARHVSVAVLLTSLAMVEVQRGNFGDALTLQQEALTIFSEANGPRAAEVGSALTNVAGILHKQGKLGDAMAVYSQALDVFSDGSGGYALGAAAVLIGMAKVHSDQKKLGLALQSLRQALKLQRSALGDAHVDVLTTKVNIADMLYGLSEFVEALDVCKDVVDTMGTGSELHNVLALTALQCMSRVLSKLGRHDEAVDVDREIVDAEKAVHGDCHPNVIAALCKLGEGAHACGQSAEAVEAYEAALDIVRATAGPSHPNVAVLLSVIANIHKEDGEFEEALAALQDALPIVEKLGGVDLAECLLDLAEAHEGLEHVSDAVDCYKRALGLLQTLPDKHRDLLASTYGSLAALFSALDRTAEADAMYKAEMDVLSTLGDQLALAAAMEEVAALRFDERRFDDALTEYHRALDVRKAAFGAFNADVAAVLSAIGFTEWRRGDHASALSFLQQALEMREATLGPLSLGVVTTLLAIGGVQNDAGKIHEAVLAWKRALHIQESLFGRQHAAVATTLSNIGFLCCDVGDYEQGLPALQQAVSLRSELCGRIHPDVLQLRVCLGDVLRKSGRHAEAHGQFRAAFDGYLETYGPDSPDAALCLALANACV